MSAIDFDCDTARQADPKGDRVKLGVKGKFPFEHCGAKGGMRLVRPCSRIDESHL